jgi:putative transposase
MKPISFKRHRFPPAIIRHAIWLYARFTLSFRDVEDLLAKRGVDASYETVRRWLLKFGPSIAANVRRSRPRPSDHWHDEMVISIAAVNTGSGVRSTTRVRCWISLSSVDGTHKPQRNSW